VMMDVFVDRFKGHFWFFGHRIGRFSVRFVGQTSSRIQSAVARRKWQPISHSRLGSVGSCLPYAAESEKAHSDRRTNQSPGKTGRCAARDGVAKGIESITPYREDGYTALEAGASGITSRNGPPWRQDRHCRRPIRDPLAPFVNRDHCQENPSQLRLRRVDQGKDHRASGRSTGPSAHLWSFSAFQIFYAAFHFI
jgi:hypothetical protein